MTEPLEPAHQLVMPFVTVTSVSGPHDDTAYCAGFEMGRLDALLQVGERLGIGLLALTIQSANQPQADLIAMHRGFTAEFTESEVPEWVYAQFEPASEGAPE